ncbi:hypothetical protein GQL56_00360 [Pseudomonas putida]|nr:hypothetical protein [Pseudomonas putida]
MDLWKPVGGVFTAVPAELADSWSGLWITLCAMSVLLIGTLVARIAWKRGKGWHVPQHAMTVGGAVTLAYMVGLAILTWGRLSTLGTMPLNEVGDFLAGAFGPVAFLWVVLGFLQQGHELKESLEQQSVMARAALHQTEMLTLERERLLSAVFSLETGRRVTIIDDRLASHGFEVRNEGNLALQAKLVFHPPINDMREKELGDFPQGHIARDYIEFPLIVGPAEGRCSLEYIDAIGGKRAESFSYLVEHDRIHFVKVFR